MSDKKVHDEASMVESKAGRVDIDGPDGVHVSMTPLAAARTGDEMIAKAAEAIGKAAMNADAKRHDKEPPYPE